jgi:hypothetical protein
MNESFLQESSIKREKDRRSRDMAFIGVKIIIISEADVRFGIRDAGLGNAYLMLRCSRSTD